MDLRPLGAAWGAPRSGAPVALHSATFAAFRFSALFCLSAALAAGCTKKTEQTTIVVYCGRSEALVGPLLERFRSEHPNLRLDVRYQPSPATATQLLVEGAQTPADVVWLQDAGYLGALADAGRLAPIPEEIRAAVDPRFVGPEGRWVGVSGRLRVLVHDKKRTPASDLPRRLEDLADEKWAGRIGWAPANASFQSHVTALIALWGEPKTRAWLEAMKALEPKTFPKNAPQVQAVASGEIDIGWVNHYYLHQLRRGGISAVNHSFAEPGDAGNLLMLSGLGLVAGGDAAAQRLASFLLSEPIQRLLAEEAFEYPVIPGVKTHPDVPALSAIPLADIDQARLADVAPALKLLRSLGIE